MTQMPWHEIVRLKPELRSGELTLAEFAADLHEVVTCKPDAAPSTKIRPGSSRSPTPRTRCGSW